MDPFFSPKSHLSSAPSACAFQLFHHHPSLTLSQTVFPYNCSFLHRADENPRPAGKHVEFLAGFCIRYESYFAICSFTAVARLSSPWRCLSFGIKHHGSKTCIFLHFSSVSHCLQELWYQKDAKLALPWLLTGVLSPPAISKHLSKGNHNTLYTNYCFY